MLRLYNTMSRSKEDFQPREPGRVKMFTCGPSIYARPHIGNYRTFLWEDVLLRHLEYLGHSVERVINFTDVEDKAIAEADKEGTTVQELTGRMAEHFLAEAAFLGIKMPETIHRASATVPESAHLIRILLDKGVAYSHNGDIYFDPLKVKGFGKLYRLDMSRWPKVKRRFSKDTYPGRRWNLGDFILWHGFKPGETISWETEIGRGRPSWNVQDPAIIWKHLGPTIDIACGGIDNTVRHHDYNIAVMEAATGQELARYWFHCEHLLVGGKKMSKSVGNILYPDDLTGQGLDAGEIRHYLLSTHYRKSLNLTPESVARSRKRLATLRESIAGVIAPGGDFALAPAPDTEVARLIGGISDVFELAMNDDLDVRTALEGIQAIAATLFQLRRRGRFDATAPGMIEREIRKVDVVLGMIFT